MNDIGFDLPEGPLHTIVDDQIEEDLELCFTPVNGESVHLGDPDSTEPSAVFGTHVREHLLDVLERKDAVRGDEMDLMPHRSLLPGNVVLVIAEFRLEVGDDVGYPHPSLITGLFI